MKPHESLRPLDPVTGLQLTPRAQPGYYPGFSTLAQQKSWDEATRNLVLGRVGNTPPIRYFDAGTALFWTIVFAHLIPQSDRTPERRIAILPHVDARLYENRTVGYRFADMPDDREAYRLGHEAIAQEARSTYARAFEELDEAEADAVLARLHDGVPRAARDVWARMSVHRFWQLLIGDAIEAYYAHPWAWDEIGFGGPAYPRAYMRLENGEPEPWEVRERRYAWEPPPELASRQVDDASEHHLESVQHRTFSSGRRP